MIRLCIMVVALALTGCATTSPETDANLTVGTAQKEIRIGMPGADVAAALGSPNIVSTDENRNEVWIYDKIYSQEVETNASLGLMVLRGFSQGAGFGRANAGHSSRTRTDRTLTVIIKFDEADLVRDFAYHTSRF